MEFTVVENKVFEIVYCGIAIRAILYYPENTYYIYYIYLQY